MFVDARTLPDGSLVEVDVDVCIVGAGAAGITIARELRGRPLRVALIESGSFTPDAVTQSLYVGSAPEQPYFPLESTRTRYFSGTTSEWNGECRPLDALDFEARDWIPDSGWPFDLAHLRPFYEKAQSLCQLGRSPTPSELGRARRATARLARRAGPLADGTLQSSATVRGDIPR